jgi:hypothetical protein
MIPWQSTTNKPISIKSKTYNPITEHDLNRLDELGDKEIGGSIHKPKKTSSWIQRVKAYSKEHGITYSQALKACSSKNK